MCWYKQQLKITVRLVTNCFEGKTNVASFYLGLNIVAEGWPVIFFDKKLTSFFNTKMAGLKIVLVMANQLCLNSFEYKR